MSCLEWKIIDGEREILSERLSDTVLWHKKSN